LTTEKRSQSLFSTMPVIERRPSRSGRTRAGSQVGMPSTPSAVAGSDVRSKTSSSLGISRRSDVHSSPWRVTSSRAESTANSGSIGVLVLPSGARTFNS
jgi:hypothetical protein